jgi:hypothetical protein
MANPKALSQGFSNGFYDIGYEHPQVHFAGSKFVNSQIPIMIGGIPIIQIKPPTEENGYFLLSAIFNDNNGMNILKIIDNEWMSPSLNWDLTVVGRKLTIRESQRNIVLELTAYPPNAIEVSNLEMYMPGQPYKLKGNANDFSII